MKLEHIALGGAAAVAFAGAMIIVSPSLAQQSGPASPNYYDTNPTPQERAQTGDLNKQQAQEQGTTENGQTGTSVQQQNDEAQQRYQQQMQAYQEQRAQYEDQQDRYRHRLARYSYDRRHPAAWWRAHYFDASVDAFYRLPRRALIGRELDERDGLVLGLISDVERYSDGHVARVQVALGDSRVAWIDARSLRYDPADQVMFTDMPANEVYDRSQSGFYNPRPY